MKALAVVLGLVAGEVHAAGCAAEWSVAQSRLTGLGATVAGSPGVSEIQGWCRVGPLEIRTEGTYSPDYLIRSFDWQGDGVQGFLDMSVVPRSIALRIDDLRIAVKTPDPLMTYLLRVQSAKGGIDADVSLAWDQGARVLTLSNLALDFPGDNAVVLSAAARNVDLSSSGAVEMSATGFAVNRMRLIVTSNGLFESYFAMPLGSALLSEEADPEAQIREIKAAVQAVIGKLPAATFPAPTKAALSDLLAEMPTPAGTLTLEMTSDAGIGPAQLAVYALTGVPASVEDLGHIFAGMKVVADYKPTGME
jgi:hypothetical protein